MAINIFSGSSNSGNKKGSSVNKASSSTRAQAAREALAAPAEVSDSGTTAVKTGGTLQKIGSVVGKVAGVASKFLPGLGGTIAKGISNLLNDPEWWQSVPGDAVTLNEPLRLLQYAEGNVGSADRKLYQNRAAILEVVSSQEITGNAGGTNTGTATVIQPTDEAVTQYLMPEIRKVVNAVTLQDAESYKTAFQSGAAIYAMWRQLKKYDYMLKHGQTYLANMNDVAFPLFRTENAAWLQSTINRLEEYLRANIRLPHTLCEYLAWRYGRVYKSNNSAKAALVLYDVLPISYTPAMWDIFIATAMNQVANTPTVQKANADLYNAYYDHDYMVEVRDDTQFRFDCKEFMLRLNMQSSDDDGTTAEEFPTLVAIDSTLDNPTAFMASTVSTIGRSPSGVYSALFPVSGVYVYSPIETQNGSTAISRQGMRMTSGNVNVMVMASVQAVEIGSTAIHYSNLWAVTPITMNTRFDPNEAGAYARLCGQLMAAKAVDLYNCGLYLAFDIATGSATFTFGSSVDMTALSIDAGAPTLTTIATEHIYAFANLVNVDRKHSMSYKQAEKLVARDTANLVDKLDIATPATKA